MAIASKRVLDIVKGSRNSSNNSRIQFQCDHIDVEMRLAHESGAGWSIIGQVLAGDGDLLPPVPIRLLRDGFRIQDTTTNFIGEFTFSNVESAQLALEIQLPNGRVFGGFEARS